MIQWMLAIWSLIPLPFLNIAWIFGISWFTYYWSLAWRILSITLLVCEMSAVYSSVSILWHCPSLRLGLPDGSEVKASAWNAGDPGSIPGSEKIPWRRQWQPTPVLLPGESHGGRSLVGYSPWGRKESETTEWLHFHFSLRLKWKWTFSSPVATTEFSKFADILSVALWQHHHLGFEITNSIVPTCFVYSDAS